jgi:hypothetical protein
MTVPLSTSATRSWWESLRADPIPWLLEGQDPGLSWRVLVELAGRPRESPAVVRERSGANAAEPVASLLAPLHPDGVWVGVPDPWAPGGGGWRVVSVVQLGADATDPRLQAACERLLEETPGDGGFAPHAGEPVLPCLTARLVQALASLGWARHLRCQEAMAWLEEAGAGGGAGGWECGVAGHSFNGSGCTVAAAALLAASAEMPPGRRENLVGRASEVLLGELGRWGSPELRGWSRFGHPNLDRTDLAEVLWALAAAGAEFDRRMEGGLRALQEAQDGRGRWMRSVPAPMTPGADAGVDHPSRWITLKAVRALREYAKAAALPRLFPRAPA